MRRLLAILLAAGPLAAGAQTPTPLDGEILFDGAATPIVNRAACQGTGTIGLTWKAAEKTPGTSFTTGTGLYSVYAKATDKTDAFPFCAAVSTDTPVATFANPTSLTVADPVQVSVSALVAAAGFDCTTANKTIYVCVLWTDGTATPAVGAYAKGTVSLQVTAPSAPTVAKVTAGDKALNVEITPATSGEAAVTFVAKAVAVDATSFPGEHRSSATAIDQKGRITGLVNGRDYYVTAYTYSTNGNESPESLRYGVQPDGTPVQPQPVLDAWEYYRGVGGRDSGGCQAGGAGLAALACAAVLMRLRRRS
jgi:hypothetical protein